METTFMALGRKGSISQNTKGAKHEETIAELDLLQ